PPTWERDHPVLERLFNLIGPAPVAPQRRRPRRQALIIPPRIRWDLDFQQIVAVLPEQRLPEGVDHLTWEVVPGGADPPETWPDQEGVRVAEVRSHALRPTSSFTIDIILVGAGSPPQERREHRRFVLPEDRTSAVFFATDGTLLSGEDGESLPSGEYLA